MNIPWTSKHLLRKYLDHPPKYKNTFSGGIWMSRYSVKTNKMAYFHERKVCDFQSMDSSVLLRTCSQSANPTEYSNFLQSFRVTTRRKIFRKVWYTKDSANINLKLPLPPAKVATWRHLPKLKGIKYKDF